jgi:FkbM family methyltransferase
MSEHTVPTLKTLIGVDVRIKVVDIGANPIDAVSPYARLLSNGEADVVGFEPNPVGLAALNASKGPFETYLPHAIGDGEMHTLRICSAPGMTSLLEPNWKVLNLFHGFPSWGQVLAREVVETIRLDDIPETAGVDFLKMDIQGAELMALENAQARLLDTLVIQSEVEFLQMYVGQPLFGDIDSFLRSRGFVFHKFYPLVSRVIRPLNLGNDIFAGLSQILWADGIFVRDFTKLERLSDRQILAMAKIMNDCYQSIDLVLHLLSEYDRRTGQSLASGYLNTLVSSGAA